MIARNERIGKSKKGGTVRNYSFISGYTSLQAFQPPCSD